MVSLVYALFLVIIFQSIVIIYLFDQSRECRTVGVEMKGALEWTRSKYKQAYNISEDINCSVCLSNDQSHHTQNERLPTPMVEGVAVTLFLGAPKWFQNRYTLMINQVLTSLPSNWVVQIFYIPSKKMSVEGISYPGIQKQIEKGNVILTKIPETMKKFKRREFMLSPWLWENMLAEKVLLFGGNSVICANSPFSITEFQKFDYIGGEGGLSIRSRQKVINALALLKDTDKGKEDSLIVKNMLKMSKESNINIASAESTFKFVVSGKYYKVDSFGAIGTLPGMNDKERQAFLDYCPETKMFFPSLHNPSCFGADPDAIGCFQFLCDNAGLKCKKNTSVTWLDKKKNTVTIAINAIEQM